MDSANSIERELFSAIEKLAEQMDSRIMGLACGRERRMYMRAANLQLAKRMTEQVVEEMELKKISEAIAEVDLEDTNHILEVSVSSRPLDYRIRLCNR